jgi:transposase
MRRCCPPSHAWNEIPGISRGTAQGIIAEIGLDMSRFPTPGHLVSWAKLSPRAPSSPVPRTGPARATSISRTSSARLPPRRPAPTPPGERYRRIVRRRGKLKALVAIARTIMLIIWVPARRTGRPLLRARRRLLRRAHRQRQARSHIRQLEALGFTVTLAQPPEPDVRHQPAIAGQGPLPRPLRQQRARPRRL